MVDCKENYGKRKSIAELRWWEKLVILNKMVRVSLVWKLNFEQSFQ